MARAMLLREWDGLTVRLRRDLQTKGGRKADAGTVGVVSVAGGRARFEVESCPHCGLSFFCLGIRKDDLPGLFEIIRKEADRG